MVLRTTYNVVKEISQKRLEEILFSIKKVKVAVIGDIAVDIYWRADMTKSELSRETPHFPLPVVEEWMSPGAGGNVAANIAALNPSELIVISIIGNDWRGDLLLNEFKKRRINTDAIIISSSRITNAYCKPMRKGISDVEYEDPRIDFENLKPLSYSDEQKIINILEEVSNEIDVLCVVDQMRFGCITPTVRNKIIELSTKGLKVVVDSRDRIGLYKNVILKPNEMEAYRALNKHKDSKDIDINEAAEIAVTLSEKNNSSVCMTLGSKGSIYTEKGMVFYTPSPEIKPPIDTCGAGDTFNAFFSCAIASGAKGYEVAVGANIAASVTIKKLGTTGTASQEEILAFIQNY